MVRLRVFNGIEFIFFKIAFQFQYGAIKRWRGGKESAYLLLFQFQYGAIKSQEFQIHLSEKPGFNSNIVRLRASSRNGIAEKSSCFNSNMVRLRGQEFQIHLSEKPGFNSNMVRLRAEP